VDAEVFERYGSTAPSGQPEEAEPRPYVVDELVVEGDPGNACSAAKESRCFLSGSHGMVR
jgi:hypothetical protein